MVIELVQELTSGFIEMCRRRLQEVKKRDGSICYR